MDYIEDLIGGVGHLVLLLPAECSKGIKTKDPDSRSRVHLGAAEWAGGRKVTYAPVFYLHVYGVNSIERAPLDTPTGLSPHVWSQRTIGAIQIKESESISALAESLSGLLVEYLALRTIPRTRGQPTELAVLL